jgi:hypothetical protein
MKFNRIAQTIFVLTMIASSIVNAEQQETMSMEVTLNNFPSSPIYNSQTKNFANDDLLSCKTDFVANTDIFSGQSHHIKAGKFPPASLKYMNDSVKATYSTMRNGVISHVTMKVALSVFNFSDDGFAAENIASYVSEGTKQYLPFEFANGVKITKVTAKGGTIVYRTEMPITKNHSQAAALALAGKVSATTTVCNDMEMVDDLLGRHIVIQYDYYDSNGDFFSSFTING